MNATESIPAGLRKVAPFPPVAARLLALLSQHEFEIKEVAELISSDPTFTARLLQCVNSYEFGLEQTVSNVRQAVGLVGRDRTRQVAVTHAMAAYTKGAPRTEELRRCWQHMIATAVLAEEIAEACGEFTKVAFTAGIVHDIGRIALLVAYPREYERLVQGAPQRCLDLLDFEREEFGLDHAEAGRLLAERWGLPEEFQVIAGRHHDPSDGSELDLLRVVHLACRLAEILGYDIVHPLVAQDANVVLAELPSRARARFNKTPEELCARIEERLLQYDSDSSDNALETSLPESVRIELDEPEPASSFEATHESESGGRIRIIVGTITVLAAVVAMLAWLTR